MRSEGFSFYFGGLGVETCSLDAASATATVGNRWQYGRAYGEFCKSGHFWRFQTSRSLVSRGRRGTLWHSNIFHNVSKVVLCGLRNTSASFSEDELHFSWRSTLETSIVILRGRRNTSDVSCGVFLANRIVRAARNGYKEFHGRRGILWDVMQIDGSLARNIDFEVANFEVHEKTCRTTPILKLQSVKKSGSLARNARFQAPTCLVSILWFSSAVAVSMGEAAKLIIFEGFKTSCHLVLRGRRGTCWHFHVSHRLSKKSFCTILFCSVFRRWVAFFVAGVRITLETSIVILHGGCVFFANPIWISGNRRESTKDICKQALLPGQCQSRSSWMSGSQPRWVKSEIQKNAAWMQLRTWHTNFVWLLHLALHHQNWSTFAHVTHSDLRLYF